MLPVIESGEGRGGAWGTNLKLRSVKLHDVALWFNKTLAAAPRKHVICGDRLHWISLWPPNVTSAATWLWGSPQKKQEVKWVGLSLLSHCGGRDDGGILAQDCSDLTEERKWLMRSGSPLGDAVLPSSKRRQSRPPWATSTQFLYHMCSPWPSLYSPPFTSAKLLRRSLNCTPHARWKTYFFILFSEWE